MLRNPKRAALLCAMISFTLPALAGDGNTPVLQQRPLSFIENKGQFTDQYMHSRNDVQFKVPGNGVNVFFGNGAMHYMWSKSTKGTPATGTAKGMAPVTGNDVATVKTAQIETYRMDVTLLGANPNAQIVKEDVQEYTERYYLPWVAEGAEAHSYNKITYQNIYPNIDWVVYSKNNSVKYDFVVRPGGNASDIKLKYDGATGFSTHAGAITVTTPMGTVTEEKPYSYDAQTKAEIASSFTLNGDVLSFNVPAHSGTMVIDPTLLWGTYYGASGDETSNDLAVDAGGNIWVAATTTSSNNLVSVGGHQTFLSGLQDGMLLRYNPNGQLAYATYYGGSDQDRFNRVLVDNSGNVYACGATLSSNGIATAGTWQQFYGGTVPSQFYGDAMLIKFNSAGQRLWGTYYGGSNYDIATGLALDASGNPVIGGITASSGSIASTGTFQTALYNGEDGFLAKLNASNGTRAWGTYYGGEDNDRILGMTGDGAGNIYTAGWTGSQNNIATTGAHQTTMGSPNVAVDGYFAKFNTSGNLVFGTYYGGTEQDVINNAIIDPSGFVYIMGSTYGNNAISTPGTFQANNANIFSPDGFVAKFNTSGVRQWGTFFGGTGEEDLNNGFVNTKGYLTIVGQTTSTGLATPSAYNVTGGGSFYTDGLFAQFSNTGQRTYSSYYGGNGATFINSVRSGLNGELIFNGGTASTVGIATPGSQQQSLSGASDAFLVKFAADTTVFITNPLFTTNCGGATFNLPYTVNNLFNANNVFTAQLSDNLGNFASPTNIGTLTANNDGTIACTIPANVVSGTQYRIRIVASSPVCTSAVNTTNIELNPVTVPTAQIVATPSGAVGPYKQVNMTVTVTNGGLTPTFQWKKNGQAIPGATTAFLTVTAGIDFLGNDQYTVDLTSNKPCASPATVTSAPQVMAINLGVNDVNANNAINIYPNPTTGRFTIAGNVVVTSLDVTNVTGQVVYSTTNTGKEISLPSSLPNGMYMIRLQTASGEQRVKLSLQK